MSSVRCCLPVLVFTMLLDQMNTWYLRHRSQQRFRHPQPVYTGRWKGEQQVEIHSANFVSQPHLLFLFPFLSFSILLWGSKFRSLVETVNEIRGILCRCPCTYVQTASFHGKDVTPTHRHTHIHTYSHTNTHTHTHTSVTWLLTLKGGIYHECKELRCLYSATSRTQFSISFFYIHTTQTIIFYLLFAPLQNGRQTSIFR